LIDPTSFSGSLIVRLKAEIKAMGTMVLLDLMGSLALLLWGLHMVHSGILRAFGPDLRLLLAKALNNRFTALQPGSG
jgi:phosphate:Na+ symporter